MQRKALVVVGVFLFAGIVAAAIAIGVVYGAHKNSGSGVQQSAGTATQTNGFAVITAVNDTPVEVTGAATTGFLTAAQVSELLTAHNNYRAKAGLVSLQWDYNVETFAHNYISTLNCAMTHSTNQQRSTVQYGAGTANSGTGVGENLAWGQGQPTLSFTAASNMWWNEISSYYYGPVGNACESTSSVGHFTQMAWNTTLYLGCAVAYCGTGNSEQTLISCNYGPAGNWVGTPPFLPSNQCALGIKPQCANPASGCAKSPCPTCGPTAAPSPTAPPSPTPAPVPPPTPAPTKAPTKSPTNTAAPNAIPTPTPTKSPTTTKAPSASPTAASGGVCTTSSGTDGCTIATNNCPTNPTQVQLNCNAGGSVTTWTLTMPTTYTWQFSPQYCTGTCTNLVRLT